jgi:hypothetical protein
MIDCVQYIGMKRQRRYMSAMRQNRLLEKNLPARNTLYRKTYGDAIARLTLKVIPISNLAI